jgi:predicted esterase YcpF (UPF0227 family)
MILYLHGFRSSPQSRKALLLKVALEQRGLGAEFACPQLPASPRAAAELVAATAALDAPERLALIGSSLGGYYATWLAERLGCRAVLLNPAIRPYDDLRAHLGQQPVYISHASIDMRPEYLDELLALQTPVITRPERYLLVATTGDEVIDYRTMVQKYKHAHQRVIEGSDHQITGFEAYVDEVLAFCGANAVRQASKTVAGGKS